MSSMGGMGGMGGGGAGSAAEGLSARLTEGWAPTELGALMESLARPSALVEAGVLALCAALAWGVVRVVARRQPRRGIWLGRHGVDGVLFPLLLLLLAWGARWALAPWVPPALFRIALPVLLSLLVIRFGVQVLHVAFPASASVRLVERLLSWMVWGAVVLWLTGALPVLVAELDALRWKTGGAEISVWSVIEGGFTAGVVLLVVLWLSSALEDRLLAGAELAGGSLSLRKMAANATRALLVFVGLLVALSAAGIPLGALSVLGGAVGVGIGFGLQKLASNYVSGFVILAERSLRIGDVVRVDGFEGRVTDIHTRYTVIRALNGRESIVPNELLITQRVENASLADPRILLTTSVQVAYGTDVPALSPRIVEALLAVPRVLADPGPAVQLAAFASDGLQLNVVFWIADPQNGQGNVLSEVNLAILRTLAEAGVEIPFPQRVVRQS
jgi:small-conductance mechanosensitive channel